MHSKNVHILVYWVRGISCPHCLHRSNAAVRAYVPSEAAAGKNFSKPIDIGAKWKSGRKLQVLIFKYEREGIQSRAGVVGDHGRNGSRRERLGTRIE